MPTDPRLQKTEQDLSRATKAAIRHFVYGPPDWTRERLGREIGYDDGQMVGKVLRGECRLLGTAETMNLSRLASAHGFDEMADLFSAPEKKTVPAAAPDTFRADLCPADELRTITEGAGLASAHIASESLRKAGQQARRAIAGGRALLAEIDAIQAGEGPPTGNGAATEPQLAAFS
jgi:hypothetical protein